MSDISSLFSEHSEIFSMYEEIRSYSGLIVVPLGEVPNELESNLSFETDYPVLMNIHLVLQLIISLMSCLSAKFLFAMIQKHR